MTPWPWLVLSILGTVGCIAGLRPWVEELNRVVELEKHGPPSTLRQRRTLIFWTVPVVVFGLIGAVGDVGLIVWLSR